MRSASIVIEVTDKVTLKMAFWGRRLIIGASSTLLIFAPLAYGAVHTWAYFTVGLVVACLSLILLTYGLYNTWARSAEEWHLPYPPLWWFGIGLVLIILLQVLPWPQAMIRWLSPTALEVRALGNGFALADYLPLSLNPYATLLEGLKVWPAVVLFFIFIYTINTRRQIQGLIGLILAVAFFEVLYGSWHFHSRLIWGWPNPHNIHRLCGTFINCNHLATMLTMAILLGFGLFLAQGKAVPSNPLNPSDRGIIKRWFRAEHLEPQFRRFLLLFLLLLLTLGLIFTGSRGGMISLLMGFVLMAFLISGKRRRGENIFLVIIFLVVAVSYSLFLGSWQSLARLQNLTDKWRYLEFKGAIAIFREYPWLGSGVSTFGDLFYRYYEPAEFKGYYDVGYAHSEWLQLLAETGIVGFSLVLAAWFAFFAILVKQWRQRRDIFARGVGLGGLAAMGAAVFNSLVEFSFHIPAISLIFASIAAITYLTLYYHRRGGPEYFSYPIINPLSHGKASAFLLFSLIGVQVAFVSQVCYNWLGERAASTEINSTLTPPKLEVQDYQRALAFNPMNSKYYFGLAWTLRKYEEENEVALFEVEKSLKAAIFQSPSNWDYRLNLAEFYLRQQKRGPAYYLPMALRELAAAVKLFPKSLPLQNRLGSILMWAEKFHPELIPLGLF